MKFEPGNLYKTRSMIGSSQITCYNQKWSEDINEDVFDKAIRIPINSLLLFIRNASSFHPTCYKMMYFNRTTLLVHADDLEEI